MYGNDLYLTFKYFFVIKNSYSIGNENHFNNS